jgi:pilus assembly protein CpaB
MQRRIIAAVAAVLLAGIGAVLLYTYVNNAETRAMQSMSPTEVLVATKVIPAGTLGANIAPYVELKQLPQVAVVAGALKDTTDIGNLAAVTDVQVGEQVLVQRFASPDTTTTGDVEVPSDLQQISVPLEVPRAVGAVLEPGNKIALFFSGDDDKGKPITGLALRDVLLVKVQGGGVGKGDDAGAAPSGTQVLTIAVSPEDATRVVYAAEHAHIWLALEPKDGGNGTAIVTPKNVLK